MKMLVPCRWLCSSSSSLGGLIQNLNHLLLCRASSSTATTAPLLTNINLESLQSKRDCLGEAEDSENWDLFKLWKSEYKKKYSSEEEMLYRFEIFKETVKSIKEGKKKSPWLTMFADMKSEEVPKSPASYRRLRLGRGRYIRWPNDKKKLT